jgi:MFS family permease
VIFLAVCWLYACIHLDRQVLSVLAESVKSDLHLSDQQLGVLTGSAFSIAYALLGLYFGILADRIDRLVLVRTGAWIWSLSCIAAALAPGYSMLVASRGGVAVGEAIATSAAVSLMSELAGETHRARTASVFFVSAFIGGGAAAMGGGAIVEMFRNSDAIAGWRAALVAAGMPGIAGALFLNVFFRREAMRQLIQQPPPRAELIVILSLAAALVLLVQMYAAPVWSVPLCVLAALGIALWWARRLQQSDQPAYHATLGYKPFRYLVLAFAALMFVDYAAAFWFIPYAQRRFQLDAASAGAQLGGLMILGGIVGCVAGGSIADRWRKMQDSGRVWTALAAVLAEGMAILIALAQTDYVTFMAAFAVFCFASGAWTGVAAAIAFDIVPARHRGVSAAAYFFLTTILGPGLGPFLVGLGSDLLGSLRMALAWACPLVLLSAASLVRVASLGTKPATPFPIGEAQSAALARPEL